MLFAERIGADEQIGCNLCCLLLHHLFDNNQKPSYQKTTTKGGKMGMFFSVWEDLK